jgi:hypothetical protein
MVPLLPSTNATFFFVTDEQRATDRTTAESPYTFSVDSSGSKPWWYVAAAPKKSR